MKHMRKLVLIVLAACLLITAACTGYPDETNPAETNALETMVPGTYIENGDNGKYLTSLSALGIWAPNPIGMEYPDMDKLLYVYIYDRKGSGNPEHSLLIDKKNQIAYYTITTDILSGAYGSSICREVDLSQTDIETITSLKSLKGVLDWNDYYSSENGDTFWLISLYFDDRTYFQSGGEYYPEEYEKLEEDIWPLLSEKTGEELWWMRGRP